MSSSDSDWEVMPVLDSLEPLAPSDSVEVMPVLDSLEPLAPSDSVEVMPVLDSFELPAPSCSAKPSASAAGAASEPSDASTSRGVRRALESDEEAAPATPQVAKRKHLYSSEVLEMWSWDRIRDDLGNEEQCLSFCEERGLLLKEKLCRYHKTPMKLVKRGAVGAFRCYKGKDSKHKNKYHSRSTGTWFYNTRLAITIIFRLMYSYARNLDYYQARIECSLRQMGTAVSEVTIADWYNYCRETVVVVMKRRLEERPKIGGPGRHVQIDESKFGRRKYNRGRRVEGHWVLGMVDDFTNELRLEVCPGNVRSAEVLIPLIQKNVAPGTIIHTDYWRGYDCLSNYGYTHMKVNHSDPNNPFIAADGTHTNHIESQWRNLKKSFYQVNFSKDDKFEDFLIEYLWRREGIDNQKDLFEELISAISKIYKP